jgi:hypothetical protein
LLLGLPAGRDAVIALLKTVGENATVAIEAIPQMCGSPGGYYADTNTAPLSMKAAMDLDARVAEVWLRLFEDRTLPTDLDKDVSLRGDARTKGPIRDAERLAAKGYVSMTGLDLTRQSKQDPVAYITKRWKEFPGVFALFGEITADKELVGQGLGEQKLNLTDPKLAQWLDFLAANNIKSPIVMHEDWGHAGLNDPGRPAPVKMAYENLPKIVQVFGQTKYRNLNVIFAHTGIGRYVRPNDRLVDVTVTNKTGQKVVRHVPEHIAMLYEITEQVPNARFDISWNDATQAYADNPALRDALVDFIMDNQDHILFGSDTVKPVNTGHYNQGLNTAAPLFAAIARRPGGRKALWKVLRGNSDDLLNAGAASVVEWTHKNLNDPTALRQMDKRNQTLASARHQMLADARAEFNKWFDKLQAIPVPSLPNNPGFFPGFFESHPEVHDHGTDGDGHDHQDNSETPAPREGANPAYGPVGRGTAGGYANEPKGSHPLATQAVNKNKIAAAAISTGAVAAGAVAVGHISGDADAAAFLGRGVLTALRALYNEKLRLDWEEIFEEGHVTRENLDALVSRIFDAAPALKISDDQRALIIAAKEQFFQNYAYLAAQPLGSYNTINGTEAEQKTQRFNAIMAKVGEFQITLDRILGDQGASINPFDARTTLGKVIRGATLASLAVNDVAALQWLTGGQIDLSTPGGKAEAAFKALFALGNAGKTMEAIAGLSGGISGRLNETNLLFMQILQKYSNGALTAAGAVWTSADLIGAYEALSQGMLKQAGLHAVKALLESAYTYGTYRVTDFQAAKADGKPTPHGRNLAWATIVLGGALVLTQIIRLLESEGDDKKKSAAAPVSPPAATVH